MLEHMSCLKSWSIVFCFSEESFRTWNLVMPGSPESKATGEVEFPLFPGGGNASVYSLLTLHVGTRPCWHYHWSKGFAFFEEAVRVEVATKYNLNDENATKQPLDYFL